MLLLQGIFEPKQPPVTTAAFESAMTTRVKAGCASRLAWCTQLRGSVRQRQPSLVMGAPKAADQELADMGDLLVGLVLQARTSRSVPLDDASREDDRRVGLHPLESGCQATLSIRPVDKVPASSYHERCRILGYSQSETIKSQEHASTICIIASGKQAVAGSVGILPVDSSTCC